MIVAVWRPTPEVSELLAAPDRVLPFVGAGLSRAAGLPAGAELARWLIREHGDGAVDGIENCLTAADAIIEGDRDRVPALQAAVAAHLDLRSRSYALSPAHSSLVRVPSGLVATFNYDLLIEEAASRVGLSTASLTLRDVDALADALHGDSAADLLVLHLHGHVEEPESIVLDWSSYSDHINNLVARNILATLFMTRTLAFLGTALDEPYLLTAMQSFTDRKPRHLLFTDQESAEALEAVSE
jgi:hypothetical protein